MLSLNPRRVHHACIYSHARMRRTVLPYDYYITLEFNFKVCRHRGCFIMYIPSVQEIREIKGWVVLYVV